MVFSPDYVNQQKRERALELASGRLRGAIDTAADREGPWGERLAGVVSALIGAVTKEPQLAALCLLNEASSSAPADPFDPRLVESLAGVLRVARAEGSPPDPGPRAAEVIAYAILAVIAERLRRNEAGALLPLADELSELAIMPSLTKK